MLSKATVAVAIMAGLVAAQVPGNLNNITLTSAETNAISLTIRAQWCLSQQNACGTLCSGAVGNNTCDSPSLTWSCTCLSNSSTPGLQYYTGSMDTMICNQVHTNCIANNANVKAAQDLCNANQKANCGTLDITNFTASAATSTTSSASATGATATSTSSSKAGAPTLMAGMQNYGAGAMAIGAAAAFGYML